MATESPNHPAGLIKKLAEVMKAVERIPKSGHNNFHNYDYATEADIVAAVRQLLAERNVMLIPAIVGRERESVGDKGSVLTQLDMTFTFFDGDSGEEKTFSWLGAGTDKEDKGAYKAMTGGEKYFLLKTFLIPTGDDPEAETDGADRRTVTASSTPPTQPATNHTPTVQRNPRPGALMVTNAKVAKEGSNDKGPWTLYAIKFSDGREATTFSKSIYTAAVNFKASGNEVDAVINGKNLVSIAPVYQQQDDQDPVPF